MSPERAAGNEFRREAQIKQYFQKADRRYRYDPGALHRPMYKYLEEVGPVNFAKVESVFRKNNFNAHFLAIPAQIVELENPQILVGDINDMFFEGRITPRPFVAIAYLGLDEVITSAMHHGFRYDMLRNMTRLGIAGAYVPNPDYTGDLSMQLIVVKKRSFGGFASPN